MDIFNEWIVKKKKSGKDYAITAGIILGGLILIFVSSALAQYLASFYLLLVAAIIYGMYIGITSLNVEYEYSVTNGELDIDKIISRRKRKRLVSVHSKNFEYFAPLNDSHKAAFDSPSITKKIDACSSFNSDKVYFAIYFKNNEKVRITFEPTERMIEDFSRYVPRSMYYVK